jgi:polysaccharide export outer membrane protein
MKSVTGIMQNELLGGLALVLIFVVLLFTSCAGNEARTQAILMQHAPASQAKADDLNSRLAQRSFEAPSNVSSADYRIGTDDLLEITVFQADELKTQVRVSANGYIKMSLINAVKAEGLTVSELENEIAKKLRKFMNEPQVSVFIREYKGQPISVLGSVKNPQVYFVTGQKYLIDMISMAGGLTPDAGNTCIVQTAGPKPGERMKAVIDLDALLVDGKSELNIPVHSGDVIQVPKSGVFFVDGSVNSPGEFPIRSGTTLTQAITTAKGLSFTAVHSDIKIFRDGGNAEREVITADYDAILAGKAQDVTLKDRDIVIVAKSGFKAFIRALAGISFYGTGFGGSFSPRQ